MKKLIVAMLILSVCILAACDNSSQPVVSGTGTGTETDTPPAAGINLNPAGNIPDGAFFANTNYDFGNLEYSNIKEAGEAFPDTFQTGDVFLYNGYMYIYGIDMNENNITDGWAVVVAQEQFETATAPAGFEFPDTTTITEVGLICESINGKPIKSMIMTFQYCNTLASLPDDFTIPSGVTNMERTFKWCEALTSLPDDFTIPSGVTNMEGTFGGCEALTSLPAGFTIPSSVTNMCETFYYCQELVEIDITIPSGVTDMEMTFYHCEALEILNDLTIPSNVTTMSCTFFNCYKLKGDIIINAAPSDITACFRNSGKNVTGTGVITLKGSSSKLSDLADTNTDDYSSPLNKVTFTP